MAPAASEPTLPLIPPLMAMNPMMQPYPMHMNMPMVAPFMGMVDMPVPMEEPAKQPVEEKVEVVPPIVEKVEKVEEVEEVEDSEEAAMEVIRSNEWEISCPTCGKSLKTQAGSLYHRCPACDNVFELQKKTKKVADEESEANE